MSQKRKRGLQRGLSDIIEKQTAPVEDKSKLSRGLIDKFTDSRTEDVPVPPNTQATYTTQGTQGSQREQLSSAFPSTVAPMRDFMKVANSIGREAVPAGRFKGKSKQIYDFLYSKTRGAIVPTMSAQLTRREIMKGAHVGSDKTIRENLLHLRSQGLISWDDQEHRGEHAGNLYRVYLPEEAATIATQGTQGSQGTMGSSGHFLPTVPTVESTQGTQSFIVDSVNTSEDRKTSFKTKEENTDDDAALAGMFNELKTVARELTGKEISVSESER